jgi:hypothetical protein
VCLEDLGQRASMASSLRARLVLEQFLGLVGGDVDQRAREIGTCATWCWNSRR